MGMGRRRFIDSARIVPIDERLKAMMQARPMTSGKLIRRLFVVAVAIAILFSVAPMMSRGAFADDGKITYLDALMPIEADALEGAQGYVYHRGSRGEAVRNIQQMLSDQWYLPGNQIDAIYGPKTEAAVRAFQEANGLTSTGIADLTTQFKLAEMESGFAPIEGKSFEYAGLKTYGVYRFDGGAFIGLIDRDGSYREGTLYYRDGSTYAGSFKANLRSGKGEAWFPNGDYYSGEWKQDNMNGTGVYHFGAMDSVEKYDGEWRDGKMSGKGVYTFPDGGTIKAIWEENRQTGWWK